jgi:hypothetical protein
MTLRLTRLHFAAAVLAIAVVSLTGPSARAFTMENLSADPGSRFADPDDRVKNLGQGTQSMQPFGQNGPIVQFGGSQGPIGPMGPFGRFQGNGFNNPPPDPYARPLGNGD